MQMTGDSKIGILWLLIISILVGFIGWLIGRASPLAVEIKESPPHVVTIQPSTPSRDEPEKNESVWFDYHVSGETTRNLDNYRSDNDGPLPKATFTLQFWGSSVSGSEYNLLSPDAAVPAIIRSIETAIFRNAPPLRASNNTATRNQVMTELAQGPGFKKSEIIRWKIAVIASRDMDRSVQFGVPYSVVDNDAVIQACQEFLAKELRRIIDRLANRYNSGLATRPTTD